MKTRFPESIDDLPSLPENTCNLSLEPGLNKSLKVCCKNGCTRPLIGKLV